MSKDKLFDQDPKDIAPFQFDEKVANCFDDMISRSVPFYNEIHRILLDLVHYYFRSNDIIYDLGCSTANTILLLQERLKNEQYFIHGIDNSEAMIKKALKKNIDHNKTKLHCLDIEEVDFKKAGMVIMNYTLQFIKKENRNGILTKIYDSLRDGGLFFMSEKIYSDDPYMDQLLIKLYYDFKKRNGYSELEIANKREALENVLVPRTSEEHIESLKKAGFKKSSMVFRWYNFACFIGVK